MIRWWALVAISLYAGLCAGVFYSDPQPLYLGCLVSAVGIFVATLRVS